MSTNQATTKQTSTNEIEWDIVTGENTDFTIQYPRFQWVHGAAQAQGFMKSGGLFVSAENFPNFAGKGFTPETLITRDGTEIPGYGAKRAELAVIRIKTQWVKDEEYNKNVPLRHVLCVINGSEDVVNISLRGASKALAFQRAFDAHLAQNVAFANRIRPQGRPQIEPFALWFPICAGELQDVHSKDGKAKSKVTPVELCGGGDVTRETVSALWVGGDNYKRFASIYQDTKKWQSTPIYENHAGVDEVAPVDEFTGGDPNAMSAAQSEIIAELRGVKNVDQNELKEMVLTVTNGASNNFRTLRKDEASSIIEMLKAA